jgi:hypothetical protein
MSAMSVSNAQAPTGCTPRTNALGRNVLTGLALGQINTALTDSVDGGSLNVITQMLGLDDLTGTNDSALQLGILTADLDPAKGVWPGTNPIDWWYLIDPTGVDSNRLPLSRFTTAAIASRQLSAGPNDITMALNLGGSIANLQMRSANLFATVDNPPAPNHPAHPPPALLADSISMFQTLNGTASGKGLCGNITVESLSKVPVISTIAQGGSYACDPTCSNSKSYTYCGAGQPVGPNCNSLLDAIVGGCAVRVLICVQVINPTQPDTAGSGYQGTLTNNGSNLNKIPSDQVTGNTRGYSSYLNFSANRGHATGLIP